MQFSNWQLPRFPQFLCWEIHENPDLWHWIYGDFPVESGMIDVSRKSGFTFGVFLRSTSRTRYFMISHNSQLRNGLSQPCSNKTEVTRGRNKRNPGIAWNCMPWVPKRWKTVSYTGSSKWQVQPRFSAHNNHLEFGWGPSFNNQASSCMSGKTGTVAPELRIFNWTVFKNCDIGSSGWWMGACSLASVGLGCPRPCQFLWVSHMGGSNSSRKCCPWPQELPGGMTLSLEAQSSAGPKDANPKIL